MCCNGDHESKIVILFFLIKMRFFPFQNFSKGHFIYLFLRERVTQYFKFNFDHF